jgi:hypothetical protein
VKDQPVYRIARQWADDVSVTLQGLRGGVVVETISAVLSGAYGVTPVVFTEPIDEIRWGATGVFAWIFDNLAYTGQFVCR